MVFKVHYSIRVELNSFTICNTELFIGSKHGNVDVISRKNVEHAHGNVVIDYCLSYYYYYSLSYYCGLL